MRVIQISDTHLSPGKRQFADNWPPLAHWIAEQRPDLVIHTGDVTVDGAGVEEDLRYCAGLMRELGVPFRTVPGNHDVGEAGHRAQPMNAERLCRWRSHFREDRWVEDVEEFRLIGINAMLIGSGEPEERVQDDWLQAVISDAGNRQVAWFLHRPLFLDDPEEGDTGYWSVRPRPRVPLMGLVRRHSVALVASGHLHRARNFLRDGTRYIWAPASAYLVGPRVLTIPMPGEERLGAVIYEFKGRSLTAQLAAVPGLSPHWIDDVIDEVYPRPAE